MRPLPGPVAINNILRVFYNFHPSRFTFVIFVYTVYICLHGIFGIFYCVLLTLTSWTALPLLLDKLHSIANHLDMICNSSKTVCMVVNPKRRCNMVAYQFPNFVVNNVTLKYVNEFKYLGHVMSNSQLDNADIHRERKNLFYRCNMLTRRFSKCSVAVILQLFKTFCLCFYDIGLWCNFTSGAFAKLQSAYVKCVKIFFRYNKFYSVTLMLNELALPRFEEIAEKYWCDFRQQISGYSNSLVSLFSRLSVL